jgi:long-chain acyl-CoA synthetase
VLIRGDNVFAGYYADEAATTEALADGWLRSGDLGALDSDGYLTITGRRKDIIITSSGKNVTPTNIEAALRERPLISQAVVYGDNRPHLVALLTLDPDELPALARRLGVPADPAALADDELVRELLEAEVDQVNERFARIEQVKRLRRPRPGTHAGGRRAHTDLEGQARGNPRHPRRDDRRPLPLTRLSRRAREQTDRPDRRPRVPEAFEATQAATLHVLAQLSSR